MLINNVRSYDVQNREPNFQGSVKKTYMFTNYAMEYAKNIHIYDEDWNKLKLFINTIRAIKTDGKTDEFVVDTIGSSSNRLWSVKYGDYSKQDEFFNSDIYNRKSYGQEKLAEDAFMKIVEFGKKYFGIAKISSPIDEFKPADNFLGAANRFRSKVSQTTNRDVKLKLIEKAKKEEKRADEAISQIRTTILCNL